MNLNVQVMNVNSKGKRTAEWLYAYLKRINEKFDVLCKI